MGQYRHACLPLSDLEVVVGEAVARGVGVRVLTRAVKPVMPPHVRASEHTACRIGQSGWALLQAAA
ncbi:MAG TPA: hypothetical protein PLA85_08955 [Micropepsaceae bacterium]|nr:hypothetical protein [Micropepsaceae bacterium]